MRFPRGIMVSAVCPWDENENLIEDVFREHVRDILAKGFKLVYIFGTCGEGYAVDTARFREVVTLFHEETRDKDLLTQVGVIQLSTANVVERLAVAHDLGFRSFQISLPCWGPMDDDEVTVFFKDVCGTFPDSTFLHYNYGGTKRTLTGADYRRVADEVPNLAATKNGGDSIYHVADLMTQAPDLQHFLSEELFPYGCLYGECSLLSSFGGISPTKTKQFFELGVSGKFDELFRLARETLDVWKDVLSPTDYRVGIAGVHDKMFPGFGGLDVPRRLLSPYRCFPQEVYERCKKILHEKYPDWVG